MKEHPILFSGEMVKAILEGRKTQTRRVIKHIPAMGKPDDWCGKIKNPSFRQLFGDYARFCPYGEPGDRLWVRETWADLRSYINETYPNQAPVAYKADDTYLVGEKWKPSIFMPRWASRITLEVVKVRVERVQEISVVDAIAEGIHPVYGAQSIMCYAQLWDSINAKRGYPWDSNPWVWVIEFKRVA